MIKYSLITFTFGDERRDLTEVFLKSCARLPEREDVEYVVVEMGSSCFFAACLPHNAFYVHVKGNVEYHRSLCMNRGAVKARGRYLIFHDSDIPLPEAFWDNLDAGLNQKSLYYANYKHLIHLGSHVTQRVIEEAPRADYGYYFIDTDADRVREHGQEGMYGGSTTIARELFDAVGGFNELMKGWGGEDTELDLRLQNKHGAAAIINQDLVHLYHARTHPWRDNPYIKKNYQILIKTMQDPEEAISILKAKLRT